METLYNDDIKKIHKFEVTNEVESDSNLFEQAEWCPKVQTARLESANPHVSDESLPSRNFSFVGQVCGLSRPDPKPPEVMSAFQAMNWRRGQDGIDLRPHIWCDKEKKFSSYSL